MEGGFTLKKEVKQMNEQNSFSFRAWSPKQKKFLSLIGASVAVLLIAGGFYRMGANRPVSPPEDSSVQTETEQEGMSDWEKEAAYHSHAQTVQMTETENEGEYKISMSDKDGVKEFDVMEEGESDLQFGAATTLSAAYDFPELEGNFDFWYDENQSAMDGEWHDAAESLGPYTTPEEYGAVGDGVTDDTQAFTEALASGNMVICQSSAYYFAGTVYANCDVATCVLDLNGGSLLNFHISYNLNQEETDWENQYSSHMLIIRNGFIGSGHYNEAADNWQTPIIKTGAPVKLENLIILNMPYLMAIADEYIDQMYMENVVQVGNHELFYDQLYLDAINYIDKNNGQIKRISSECTGLAGDAWIFNSCNEWRWEGNPEYKFLRTCRNNAVSFRNCIQSAVEVGQYSRAVFIGCHWEEENTMPTVSQGEMGNLYLGSISFIGCYFYAWHTFIDYPQVTYLNCLIRQTYDNNTGRTLAETMGNKTWTDLKCRIIGTSVGGNFVVDNEAMKRVQSTPKQTFESDGGKRKELVDGLASVTSSTWGGTFYDTGDYRYQVYLLATSNQNVAVDSAEKTAKVLDQASAVQLLNVKHVPGGYGVLVYRTSPNGVVEKAIAWTEVRPGGELDPDASIAFDDYGSWAKLKYTSSASETEIPLPWIEAAENEEITLNKKMYESDGVLVNADGSDATQASGKYANNRWLVSFLLACVLAVGFVERKYMKR